MNASTLNKRSRRSDHDYRLLEPVIHAPLTATRGKLGLGMAIWATALRLNGDAVVRMASQWTRETGMDMEQRRQFMAFVSTVAEGVIQRDARPIIRTSMMGPEYDDLTAGPLAQESET